VTTTAARVLGVTGHRLEEGGNADLVVHRRQTLRSVLAHRTGKDIGIGMFPSVSWLRTAPG
jgi:imidazolonepropionase-like amidohydrolase